MCLVKLSVRKSEMSPNVICTSPVERVALSPPCEPVTRLLERENMNILFKNNLSQTLKKGINWILQAQRCEKTMHPVFVPNCL